MLTFAPEIMNSSTQTLLTTVATELADVKSLCGLFHEHRDGDPLPSQPALAEMMDLCRSILFPGFYGKSTVNNQNLVFHIGVAIEKLYGILCEQIQAGLCFATGWNEVEAYGNTYTTTQDIRRKKAGELTRAFIERLPSLRQTLSTDVEAAYLGDPAADLQVDIFLREPVADLHQPGFPGRDDQVAVFQSREGDGVSRKKRQRIGRWDHGGPGFFINRNGKETLVIMGLCDNPDFGEAVCDAVDHVVRAAVPDGILNMGIAVLKSRDPSGKKPGRMALDGSDIDSSLQAVRHLSDVFL